MFMRALKGASTLAKRAAYFSVCLPILEYASRCRTGISYMWIKIESINREAVRRAYGLRKYDRISAAMNSRPTCRQTLDYYRLKLEDFIFIPRFYK